MFIIVYNLLCFIMHTTDKHILDKLAENGIIIIGFMKYSSFALYFDYPYVIFILL